MPKSFLAEVDSLPILPDTAIRLQELLKDEKSSLNDIAEVVSVDPSLASKLLKLANSALYNSPSEVTSLTRAVMVIGSDALYSLALANSAVTAFPSLPGDAIQLERFWHYSVDTGLIAKLLGQKARLPNREKLFAMGLLHNIGELICVKEAPEKARECSIDFQAAGDPRRMQEQCFGFNYAALSAELMKHWSFPSELREPIAHLYQPETCPHPKDAHALAVASHSALSMNNPERFTLLSPGTEISLTQLQLTAEDLQEAVEYANLEAMNILAIISPAAVALF